jgi:hypothetical protein
MGIASNNNRIVTSSDIPYVNTFPPGKALTKADIVSLKFSEKIDGSWYNIYYSVVGNYALNQLVQTKDVNLNKELFRDCPPGPVPECPFPDPEYTVFFPHPNDCFWFFHCNNGVAYCKNCKVEGLHWNAELETCDYAYRAGCEY